MANIDSDSNAEAGRVNFKFVTQEPPTSAKSPSPGLALKQARDDHHGIHRASRACDECRRRKIKCDSQAPCSHCRTHFCDCTYEHQKIKKKPKPRQSQKPEGIEDRLRRIEAFIQESKSRGHRPLPPAAFQEDAHENGSILFHDSAKSYDNDSDLEDMVTAVGRISLHQFGKNEFNGTSSGISFLESFRRQFGDHSVDEMKMHRPLGDLTIPHLFDSIQYSYDRSDSMLLLPTQEVVTKLAHSVFDDACTLAHFIHRPTFFQHLELIYNTHPSNYGEDEKKFLPLLYSVLALGFLFDREIQGPEGYQKGIQEGIKYLLACRRMIDPTHYRDLTTLQAMTIMIMFLMCTLRTATLYSYVGTLMRLAVQIGLHRALPGPSDLIIKESRIRLFWVIRSIDTWVATLLGLPRALSDEDIDQDLPTDTQDECILKDNILPAPDNQVSDVSGLIAYIGLLPITNKIVRNAYPVRLEGMLSNETRPYMVRRSKIQEIEQDLQRWKDGLRPGLWPDSPAANEHIERMQYMVQMAYLHAQLLLYHPFMQYIGAPKDGNPQDYGSSKYANDCVAVCHTIIDVAHQMQERNVMTGAFWFSSYTIYFAILALVVPVLNNSFSEDSDALLEKMASAREVIGSIRQHSESADRCYRILGVCFEKLSLEKRTRSTTAHISHPTPSTSTTTNSNSNGTNLAPKPYSSYSHSSSDTEIEGDFSLPAQENLHLAFQQPFMNNPSDFSATEIPTINPQMPNIPLSLFEQNSQTARGGGGAEGGGEGGGGEGDEFQQTLDALFRNSTKGAMARAVISSDPGGATAFFQPQAYQTNAAAASSTTGNPHLFGGAGEGAGMAGMPSVSLGSMGDMNLQAQSGGLGFSELVEGLDDSYNVERWNA